MVKCDSVWLTHAQERFCNNSPHVALNSRSTPTVSRSPRHRASLTFEALHRMTVKPVPPDTLIPLIPFVTHFSHNFYTVRKMLLFYDSENILSSQFLIQKLSAIGASKHFGFSISQKSAHMEQPFFPFYECFQTLYMKTNFLQRNPHIFASR